MKRAGFTFCTLALLGLLALSILLGLAAGAGAAPPKFHILELYVPGQVEGIYPMGIDDDAMEDLAVVHSVKGAYDKRYISVFYGRKGEGYHHRPDITLTVPEEACVFFMGNYHPSRGKELAWFTSDGIYCTTFKNRKIDAEKVRLAAEETFFVLPDRGALPYWDPFIDIDKNGLLDIVIPKPDGYGILFQGPEGTFPKRARIPLEGYHSFGHYIESRFLNRLFSFNSFMPRVFFGDYNGNGLQDAMAFQNRGVAIFLHKKRGVFAEKPDIHLPLKLLEGKPLEGEDAFKNTTIQMADVDGDRRCDMIISKVMGRIGFFESMMTQQLLFLNSPKGINGNKPDQILNLRGISMAPKLVDVDGD